MTSQSGFYMILSIVMGSSIPRCWSTLSLLLFSLLAYSVRGTRAEGNCIFLMKCGMLNPFSKDGNRNSDGESKICSKYIKCGTQTINIGTNAHLGISEWNVNSSSKIRMRNAEHKNAEYRKWYAQPCM